MQFMLYENRSKIRKTYPYFISIQNVLFDSLNSRVVTPLTLLSRLNHQALEKLCPVILVNDENYALLTYQLTSVPVSGLSHQIDVLDVHRQEILSALDFLFTGIQ